MTKKLDKHRLYVWEEKRRCHVGRERLKGDLGECCRRGRVKKGVFGEGGDLPNEVNRRYG